MTITIAFSRSGSIWHGKEHCFNGLSVSSYAYSPELSRFLCFNCDKHFTRLVRVRNRFSVRRYKADGDTYLNVRLSPMMRSATQRWPGISHPGLLFVMGNSASVTQMC